MFHFYNFNVNKSVEDKTFSNNNKMFRKSDKEDKRGLIDAGEREEKKRREAEKKEEERRQREYKRLKEEKEEREKKRNLMKF